MDGKVLSALAVPHELIDLVRRRNEHGSDRAADADSAVSDRDVDRLLFEKFANRVSKFCFHFAIVCIRYRFVYKNDLSRLRGSRSGFGDERFVILIRPHGARLLDDLGY